MTRGPLRSDRARLAAALALAAAAAILDCGGGPPADSARDGGGRRVTTSNVLRADYAGSAACARCHAEISARWGDRAMHRMTRSVPTEIRAPFEGGTIRVGPDRAHAERRGDARLVRLERSGKPEQLFRVTRVIGGRTREDFVGVDVTGAADPARAPGSGKEQILPMTWVFGSASWRYKGYSVQVEERPWLTAGPAWAETCIGCHNTLPQLTMLLDDVAGPGAPSFQGSIADDLLPRARRSRARVRDAQAFVRAARAEIAALGAPPPQLAGEDVEAAARAAIHATEQHLGGDKLIEEGIGCEACHGGAREHAADPSIATSFVSVSPALAVAREDGGGFTRAEAQNRACARCHTVLFSKYPWTWEGGGRKDAVPGGSTINSGEARDFLLGGCASELTCTSCHDPHGADSPAKLARMGTVAGNPTCTRCHARLAEEGPLRAHSGHDPKRAGAACLGCHMPQKNMGLDYGLVRYHRIGSPTDPERLYGDRPIECALCHADASAATLADQIERLWHKPIDRARLARLYDGKLEEDLLGVVLAIGKPHEQAVAAAAIGARGRPDDACALARQLLHPYPLVRFFAQRALEKVTGAAVPLDVGAPAETLRGELGRWCAP